MQDISNSIKDFIKERFLGDNQRKIQNSDLLFAEGIIDSLGLLELIAFIEKTFGVRIKMSEIGIDNFESVEKITNLIKSKKEQNR